MELGGWIVAVAAVAAFAGAFALRTRAPSLIVAGILASAGAGVGWGGMLIQPAPSTGEFIAAVAIMAVMLPAHVRIVIGPFGPRR